jgi:uncharacterized protein
LGEREWRSQNEWGQIFILEVENFARIAKYIMKSYNTLKKANVCCYSNGIRKKLRRIKRKGNQGVTSDKASSAFRDTLSLTVHDPLHSEEENRFILIGNSHKNRLLVIVHTERGDRIRIISARKAIKNEVKQYEENAKRSGDAGRI